MAKNNLVLLAALLATALLATALATTTITTTVTTTDESNPAGRCQRQLQGRRFRACQNYFSQGRRSSYDGEMIEMVSDVANPGQQEQQYLRDCCQRIRQVDEQCQCEAIKQAVRSAQQQHGGYGGQEMQQIYQKARSLPSQCNLRVRQCEIRAIFV